MAARQMTAKYAGTCQACNTPIKVGQDIYWHGKGHVEHVDCMATDGDDGSPKEHHENEKPTDDIPF